MSMNQRIRRMKRSSRYGTVAFVSGIILLAVIIVVNLLVGALPTRVTKLEVAKDSATRISKKTADFVKSIDTDVTIYWLCEGGTSDGQLEILLSRYTDLNDHISVEVVDPAANPYFTADYTQDELTDQSFIVRSDRRFTVVDFADLTEYEVDVWNEVNGEVVRLSYAELESLYQQYGSYLADATVSTYFKGETALNTALEYVTIENIPHGYLLTGHGDAAFPEDLSEALASYGMELETINLQNLDAVPADAGYLILFAPASDVSPKELTMMRDYFTAGGSLLLVTDPQIVAECPNVCALGESFGLVAEQGMIADSDPSHNAGSSPYLLVPTPNQNQYISYLLGSYGYTARLPYAHSIALAPEMPVGVTASPMLTTSEKAIRRTLNGSATLSDGPSLLNVAAAADRTVTKDDGSTKTGHMVWFGSTQAFNAAVAQETSYGNYFYFIFSVMYMSENFSTNFAVDAIDMNGFLMSDLTTMSSLVWIAVIVVVIPLCLLLAGIIIWVRRKRR